MGTGVKELTDLIWTKDLMWNLFISKMVFYF